MRITSGRDSLEDFLRAILRGAAKILGCNSTNLILINERTDEIRVLIGAMAPSYPVLDQIERVLGNSFKVFSLSVELVRDSLVYRAWREHTIHETSLLSELVGGAFATEVTAQVARLAGDQRFICVPALSGARNYGVLLFTKEGRHPFSRQQRDVLLRYARRIGEIVENDLMGQGPSLIARPRSEGPEHLLFDGEAALVGQSSGELARQVASSPAALQLLQARVRAFIAGNGRAEGSAGRGDEPADSPLLGTLEPRLARFTLAATPDGPSPAVICSLHRREAERESLENQLLQLTLGEAAPALFIDPDLRITSCNEAAEQLFGHRAAELRGRAIATLFCEPAAILEILGRQVLAPATPYAEESTTILRRDGAICPARVEALYLADELHRVVGFLVLVRDTSAEGEESADRLIVQERLATMGEMATQLAHEIRNPLLAIGATLQGLVREAGDEQQRAILTTLSREINRMDMLLRDYLAARHDMSFAEVSLAEAVDDARCLLEGARKMAGTIIEVAIDPALTVMADHDALKHVFFNLLLNALEASTEPVEVRCRATEGEHDVTVLIEDRGAGLGAPAADCLRPFFTTKKNGTGLGLAVCHKIIRAHGGLVELRARSGGGCQARAIFPRRARGGEGSEAA
jgi:PAS domain S-box-containing protein